MTNPDALNPRLPFFLRAFTALECLIVLASALLVLIPPLTKDYWPWIIPPFNARYVGAIYLATLFPLLLMVIIGRWSPGKLVLWMIFVFTTAILLTMIVHFRAFEWGRFTTYIFWGLYILLPVNGAIHLLIYWKANRGTTRPAHILMSLFLLVLAGSLLPYCLALMIVPQFATVFWPWRVDAFHARIYLAIFLAPAMGALFIVRRAAPAEYLALGLLLVAFGLLAIVGVVITHFTVSPDKQVNYANLGTWIFFGLSFGLAAIGTFLSGFGLFQGLAATHQTQAR